MATDLQPDEAVAAAARWIAHEREPGIRPVVPDVRTRFGLTTPEVIEAIRIANTLRAGGPQHG